MVDPMMAVLALVGIISIVIIMSIVHISGKTDQIAKSLDEIKELLKDKSEK